MQSTAQTTTAQPKEPVSSESLTSSASKPSYISKDQLQFNEEDDVLATSALAAEYRKPPTADSPFSTIPPSTTTETLKTEGPRRREKKKEAEESTAPSTFPAAPSCFARFCMYVKHRIAAFFDWVCSLFCGSKLVTKQEFDAAKEKWVALLDKYQVAKRLDTRYPDTLSFSPDAIYCCVADAIEVSKSYCNFLLSFQRIEGCERALSSLEENPNQPLSTGEILTERQLRSDYRQAYERLNDLLLVLDPVVPTTCTEAMKEKVKAYFLGKTTMVVNEKRITLVDDPSMGFDWVNFNIRNNQFASLKDDIRKPILKELQKSWTECIEADTIRYSSVTLKNLTGDEGESQAVRMLADYIEIEPLFSMYNGEDGVKITGDISQASTLDYHRNQLKKLKERLDCTTHPILGTATPEMRKKVKECAVENYDLFDEFFDDKEIFPETEEGGEIRDLLKAVLKHLINPQPTPDTAAVATSTKDGDKEE